MQFDLETLGRWTEERVQTVDSAALAAYAAATNDAAGLAAAERVAPPVFAIVPAWAVLQEAADPVAPQEAKPNVVHGDQDILISAPIEPGMTLRSRAAAIGIHVKDSGTTVVLKTETRDDGGTLLNEQYVTEFYRGISGGTGGGETAPDHRLPAGAAEAAPAAEITYPIDADQTQRYAAASGDDHTIHLDDRVARDAGLPGVIVHGMCLMAFAGRAVLESRGESDPGAIRRLATRFSRPVEPGSSLTTRIHPAAADGGSIGFDAVDEAGATVLKDGLAELGPAPGGAR
jgi:acyl dehydratase